MNGLVHAKSGSQRLVYGCRCRCQCRAGVNRCDTRDLAPRRLQAGHRLKLKVVEQLSSWLLALACFAH